MRIHKGAGALALLALAVGGCASNSTHSPGLPAVLSGVPYETTADGEHVVVVRDYVELQKDSAGADERHRVQYVWNYDRGLAQRRTWDIQGISFETVDFPYMTLNATQPELDWMFATLRADARWSKVLTDDMDYYGGFSVREPGGDCDTGTRCVHVIIMRDDGRERILHGIFDLASGKLVDDDVDPTLTGIGQRKVSNGEKK